MPVCILGIETSCDETSAAVVADGRRVLSSVVFSQMGEHAAYGGVVPEIASRRHVEAIIPVIDEALAAAGLGLAGVDAVAATYGPGLAGALLVGLSAAKGLALAAGKPLIGVHHICAHICANYLEFADLEPPFTALAVSGGHSHIYLVRDCRTYELLGRTRDDAAGEAFDKVARAAGLGYPGGPKLDAAARGGNPDAIRFPKAGFADNPYDFSFSGVKTAALNCLNRERQRLGAVGFAVGAGGTLPEAMGRGSAAGVSGGALSEGARTQHASANLPSTDGERQIGGSARQSESANGLPTGVAQLLGGNARQSESASQPTVGASLQPVSAAPPPGGGEWGLPPEFMRDFYASFQKAVVDVLVEHTVRAELANGTGKIVLAGGVAANTLLRARFAEETAKLPGVALYCPPPALCTDNAAMVACAAHSKFASGDFSTLALNAAPGAGMP
jgi:tRNA threonylcarbamoyl adenosine modification protein TsaD